MRNLLKYEIKQGFLPYIIMGVFFGIGLVGVVAMIKNVASGSSLDSHSMGLYFGLFSSVCTFLLMSSILGFIVVQILNIINAFGKNLFGAYGYLLFCLPLGIDRILLAKVLGCFILIGASFVYVGVLSFCALVFLSDFSLFGVMSEFISRLSRVDLSVSIGFIAINLSYGLCSILEFLLQILLTLAVLNFLRISSFRLVVGIVIFIGISMVTSIVGVVLDVVLSSIGILPEAFDREGILRFFDSFFDAPWLMEHNSGDLFIDSLKNSLRFSLIFYNILSYILTSLAYYLLARFLIVKKLELE
ncbi:hypothetical protein [Helicobacter sp. T3_23-1059]